MIETFRRRPLTVVFLLALLLLLPGTATLPLIDRDEPRFAQATVEMMHRHEWVVPYFNGDYRFDKPVLVYWLMRAGYALLGIGELGARLHTVLAGAALAVLLFATARKWFSEKAGWVAAAGFLACLQVQIHGRLCLADMPMVLCVTLACRAIFELLHPENNGTGEPYYPWKKWWTLWLAMGVGFLAKGPVVLAVPAVALIFHRLIFLRQPLPWARLKVLPGAALALAVVAPWGLLALYKTHGLFWKIGMEQHVIERGVEGWGGQKFGALFYAGTVFLSLCPAIAYAGRIARSGPPCGEPRRAWLLSWFLAPVAIFSLYATKLPHYILPGFPAFFLLLGAWAATPTGERPARGLLWQRMLFSLYAVIAGVGAGFGLLLWTGVATVHGNYADGLRDFGAAAFHLAGAIAGAWLVTFGLSRAKPLRWVAPGVLTLAASFAGGAHYFRKTSPAVALETAMRAAPAKATFIATGFEEGSLVFYADQKWTFMDKPEELRAAFAKPGPIVLVALDERANNEKLLGAAFAGLIGRKTGYKPEDVRPVSAGVAAGMQERARFSGFSPGNGKWVTVRLLVRE